MIAVDDPDFTLHAGDVLDILPTLPAGSVDCVITSPPYWGLRDYGTAGQIGLEATPDAYLTTIVAVFRELRRVLASHGTCWVNMGDAFQDKQLVGIPWRVAFALQTDGWYLRADVIWAKPNPMPESVTDRPAKAHEYVFLLTKQPRYWYDTEAVREPHADTEWTRRGAANGAAVHAGAIRGDEDGLKTGRPTFAANTRDYNPAGRNIRTVWEIATQPTPEAHFATYPEELVRRCLLAGCPTEVCRRCGKPRERIVETSFVKLANRLPTRKPVQPGADMADVNSANAMGYNRSETLGWSDCGHDNYRPGVVLDPFIGSGTTALVARRHQRRCVGIELNPDYARIAIRKTQQLSLLA